MKPERILNAFLNNEQRGDSRFQAYSLKNIKTILSLLGNPHRELACIHVAGTNGKGSVSIMLSAILRRAGYRVGLYTSPHLRRLNERIQINGRRISDKELLGHMEHLQKALANHKKIAPTYFDALTILAFMHFKNNTDVCIIEVGLGGRLDSTNVITPLISVITSISLDHTALLGSSLASIAAEKAGIIKRGKPVVVPMFNDEEIKNVIEQEALSKKASVYMLGRDFFSSDIRQFDYHQQFTYYTQTKNQEECHYCDIHLNAPSPAQISNACLAIKTVSLLASMGFSVRETHIRSALARLQIPGRMEYLSLEPLVIYDPAHNEEAIRNLISTLRGLFMGKNFVCLISLMKDKNYTLLLELLTSFSPHPLFIHPLDDPRSLSAGDIAELQKSMSSIILCSNILDIGDHLKHCMNGNTALLITGTFRLYEFARRLVKALNF